MYLPKFVLSGLIAAILLPTSFGMPVKKPSMKQYASVPTLVNAPVFVGAGTYPRANKLSNGNLILSYTAFENGNSIIRVVLSTDGGTTWCSPRNRIPLLIHTDPTQTGNSKATLPVDHPTPTTSTTPTSSSFPLAGSSSLSATTPKIPIITANIPTSASPSATQTTWARAGDSSMSRPRTPAPSTDSGNPFCATRKMARCNCTIRVRTPSTTKTRWSAFQPTAGRHGQQPRPSRARVLRLVMG